MATGAARSEPRAMSRCPHAVHQRWPGHSGAGWCTRGAGVYRVSARCAQYTRVDECIYGCIGAVRPGQAGAETVPEPVLEQCQNSVNNGH